MTHLSRDVSLSLELNGLERTARREHGGTLRPAICLLRGTLGLGSGVGEREDDGSLVELRHLFDHGLIERFGYRGYPDDTGWLEGLDGRD